MTTLYFAGVDIGQMQDYTAIAVVRKLKKPAPFPTREDPDPKTPRPEYQLVHLERLPLGTPYPTMVKRVSDLMHRDPLHKNCELVVDATGVGRPVVDMFEDARLDPTAVTITGGDTVTQDRNEYRVPKRDLIINLQVLLQQGRLKIAEALPDSATLVRELLEYKVKIDPVTAHDTYNAREGAHDDLVLAAAMACWRAENYRDVVILFSELGPAFPPSRW